MQQIQFERDSMLSPTTFYSSGTSPTINANYTIAVMLFSTIKYHLPTSLDDQFRAPPRHIAVPFSRCPPTYIPHSPPSNTHTSLIFQQVPAGSTIPQSLPKTSLPFHLVAVSPAPATVQHFTAMELVVGVSVKPNFSPRNLPLQ